MSWYISIVLYSAVFKETDNYFKAISYGLDNCVSMGDFWIRVMVRVRVRK